MEKTSDCPVLAAQDLSDAPALVSMWEKICSDPDGAATEEGRNDFIQLVDRRLIIACFQDWTMSVVDPVFGRVEAAIGDYLKYYRTYLFFYSDGSPRARRRINSAFRFVSRLAHLLRRLFTRSLKPRQPWAESATDQDATPRSSKRTATSCVPPQSGHGVADN